MKDGQLGTGAGAAPTRRPSPAAIAGLAALAGAVVTVVLLIVGRVHTPDYTFSIFGQAYTSAISLKSLLATVVLALAAVQVLLALWIYGKLPGAGRPPRAVAVAHRASGFLLIAVTLPVAIHCLIAYGVQFTSARVALHSLAGCFLYGAFTAKVLLVRSRRLPGWALPVAGGMLAVLVVLLWYTAALWYYNGYRVPGL